MLDFLKCYKTKLIVFPLLLLFSFTLFLGFIPRSNVKADTNETYYTFHGSVVTLPYVNFLSTNSDYQKGVSWFSLSFLYDESISQYIVRFGSGELFASGSAGFFFKRIQNIGFASTDYDVCSKNVPFSNVRLIENETVNNSESAVGVIGTIPNDNKDTSLRAYLFTNNRNFVPDIYKIVIGHRDIADPYTKYNFVRYYDINDYYIEFGVYAGVYATSNQPGQMLLQNRTYFLADLDSNDYNLGYTNGYRDGETDGIIKGEEDTKDYWYQQGVNAGIQQGVNENKDFWYQQGVEYGKILGQNQASNYTFLSLMTAVIDAPLQVFTDLFEFDILGVNMKTFYLSLFTACIIIFILRKVL